ncbi:hypothetical protein V500_02026 [Pseudogymnoascus sp. VKM F-4518 (FW-2643)]|nr:hypothetical protein V500_02026 [Pseudogymnoascus sp. VKM F-4518 (FW-2643)]
MSYYLFDTGYHPDQITLGTLVYKNYARPDVRCATFPKVDETKVENQNVVLSQEINGSWGKRTESQYGFGVDALNLATIRANAGMTYSRIVSADRGRRVHLKDPMTFFSDEVIQSAEIRKKLAIWLTASKSSYLFRRATFQKPKVYCVTGVYELTGVRSISSDSWNVSIDFNLEPLTLGAATGIPIGFEIGPFQNGEYLRANVAMPKMNIWMARFHQLNVEYLRMAASGETPLPTRIDLRPDVTYPRGGLMAGEPTPAETKVLDGAEVLNATVVNVGLSESPEVVEDEEDGKYWEAFEEAERRLERDAEDSSEENE